jgi:hypothetical protein
MIGQRASQSYETGDMAPQKMIVITIFKGLLDCLTLHFVHAVHWGFRRLYIMSIIPQHTSPSLLWPWATISHLFLNICWLDLTFLDHPRPSNLYDSLSFFLGPNQTSSIWFYWLWSTLTFLPFFSVTIAKESPGSYVSGLFSLLPRARLIIFRVVWNSENNVSYCHWGCRNIVCFGLPSRNPFALGRPWIWASTKVLNQASCYLQRGRSQEASFSAVVSGCTELLRSFSNCPGSS